MTTYRVADGFDVPLLSLTTISPQPSSEAAKPLRRTYGGSGAVYDEGLYIELEWSVLESQTEYQALLVAFFGAGYAATNEITLYAPSPQGQFQRYNGIAVLPENGRDVRRREYFWRELAIVVKGLYLAS